MPKKYAIRITRDNLDLIELLSPWGRPTVEQYVTYFLFTVDSPTTTTDHDIVAAIDFKLYDGDDKSRIVLK